MRLLIVNINGTMSEKWILYILLQQNTVGDQLAALNSDISNCNSSNEVESCVSVFVRIIDTVSAPLFKKSA